MQEPTLVRHAYRFELAPTEIQAAFLRTCTGASRFWFNQGLALVKERLGRRDAGETVDIPWSYRSLCSAFAPVKDTVCPWRGEVVVGSQQAGLEALGRALQSFSRARREGRRTGFPRFRREGACTESVIFQRPRLRDGRHVCLDRRLGPIRTKEPLRKLIRLLARDPCARIIRSTVSQRGGRWWVSFQVERSPKQRRARRPRAVVGVDLGIKTLVTLSTSDAIENARPLERALHVLRREQRRLDRQRRASNPENYLRDGRVRPGARNWKKSGRMLRTERRIRRLHERARNLRREQTHRVTTALAREFGVIGVESLNVAGMLHNKRLARPIADVGWGGILAQLAYKTAWAGSLMVSADTYYPSSRTCSSCGTVKAKLSLSERVFTCDRCGHVADRDLNAACNLAHIALAQARSEGIARPYLARTGRERLNARGATDPAKRSRGACFRRATAENREGSSKELARSRGGSKSPRLREKPALALG